MNFFCFLQIEKPVILLVQKSKHIDKTESRSSEKDIKIWGRPLLEKNNEAFTLIIRARIICLGGVEKNLEKSILIPGLNGLKTGKTFEESFVTFREREMFIQFLE